MIILGSPEEKAIPVGYVTWEMLKAIPPVPTPFRPVAVTLPYTPFPPAIIRPPVVKKPIPPGKIEIEKLAPVTAEVIGLGKYIPWVILGAILIS